MEIERAYIRHTILAVAAAYFIFAGAVQYNDPDPLHWMLLYFLSALVCAGSVFRRIPEALIFMTAGMALAEMAITLGGVLDWLRLGKENVITTQMTPTKPHIELTREFLGAAICLVVMLLLARSLRKQGRGA